MDNYAIGYKSLVYCQYVQVGYLEVNIFHIHSEFIDQFHTDRLSSCDITKSHGLKMDYVMYQPA